MRWRPETLMACEAFAICAPTHGSTPKPSAPTMSLRRLNDEAVAASRNELDELIVMVRLSSALIFVTRLNEKRLSQ
jgi:hypothetical protein